MQSVRTGYVVALLVVFFVGFGLMVCLMRADNTSTKTLPNAQEQFQPRLYTESIDRAFVVPQLSDKAYTFSIPVGAKDATLRGHFTATGGAHNDIEVWLTDDDGYVNWKNKHPIAPIYDSGRITQGTLDVSLPSKDGIYYLIFNNRFSLISPKAVQDSVSLQYKR